MYEVPSTDVRGTTTVKPRCDTFLIYVGIYNGN